MIILTLTLLPLIFFSSAFGQVQGKWSESEHLQLGELGALKACTELGITSESCPIKNIQRADKKLSFSYGDLVAAADFYDEAMDMDKDRALGISQIIRCIHAAVNDLPDMTPKTSDSSNCNLSGFLSIPGYLEVLTTNYNHFGWNNMVAYVENHRMALKKAQEAFQKKTKSPRESRRLFYQALIYNGFADHYLTDAFSSGHIRIPRIQLKNWAKKNLSGPLTSYRGDLLSLVVHDQESRNLRTGQEEGLRVKNSLGDQWLATGDGELHTNVDAGDMAFTMPLLALKQSFKELLVTWMSGEIPDGNFAATWYVPFHHDVSLAIKFSPEYQRMKQRELIRLIYSSIPFFPEFWFRKSDVERMLTALPGIFFNFRSDINKEIQKKSELQKRLPSAYLDAYQRID